MPIRFKIELAPLHGAIIVIDAHRQLRGTDHIHVGIDRAFHRREADAASRFLQTHHAKFRHCDRVQHRAGDDLRSPKRHTQQVFIADAVLRGEETIDPIGVGTQRLNRCHGVVGLHTHDRQIEVRRVRKGLFQRSEGIEVRNRGLSFRFDEAQAARTYCVNQMRAIKQCDVVLRGQFAADESADGPGADDEDVHLRLFDRRHQLTAEVGNVGDDAPPHQAAIAEGGLIHPRCARVDQIVFDAQAARGLVTFDDARRNADESCVAD